MRPAAPLAQVLGDTTHTYVYGHQRLLAVQSDTRIWHLHDALGSLRMTLDGTGTPQSLHSYDAWGVVQEGTPAPFGFTGEVQQAGLVYLRARWYAAGSGTFTSRDPFAGYAQQPYSLHPYQYAYSDPLRWTDPSGRCIPGFDPDCRPVFDCFILQRGCQRSDLNLADGRKYVQMVGEPFVGVWNAAYHDITRSPQQRWDDFTFHLTHYSPLAVVFAPTDPLALPVLGAGPNLRWQWEQGVATWQSFSTYIGDMVCRDSARLGRGLSKTALALITWRGGEYVARSMATRSVRSTLLAELHQLGIKHTPEAIVRIAKMPDGQIVFLEQGNLGPRPSGLVHILADHANDFARKGISKQQIPDLLIEARVQNRIVGYQGKGTGRPIYAVSFNGRMHYVAITIGSNGYIVGANPTTKP